MKEKSFPTFFSPLKTPDDQKSSGDSGWVLTHESKLRGIKDWARTVKYSGNPKEEEILSVLRTAPGFINSYRVVGDIVFFTSTHDSSD